jgi:putative two-component system response regulator
MIADRSVTCRPWEEGLFIDKSTEFLRVARRFPFSSGETRGIKNMNEAPGGWGRRNDMNDGATILFVDDEPNILKAMKRLFRNETMRVLTSTNAVEALDLLKKNDVCVVISDNIMPGMTGIEFFQKVKTVSPECVKVMVTGCTDFQAAISAINKGEVYKFITKPWDDHELKNIIFESVQRHNMVHSLRKADDSALYSLAQTIELKDPYTKGHCDRVARYAVSTVEALGLGDSFRDLIERGSWLHDCGKIGVPEAILNHDGPLSEEQMDIVRNHPVWGADVARLAQLPEVMVNIILHHHERYNGAGYPLGLAGNAIPLEARIVNVADIYDALTSDRPYRSRFTPEKGVEILIEGKGTYSDPQIVDVFVGLLREQRYSKAS